MLYIVREIKKRIWSGWPQKKEPVLALVYNALPSCIETTRENEISRPDFYFVQVRLKVSTDTQKGQNSNTVEATQNTKPRNEGEPLADEEGCRYNLLLQYGTFRRA